MERHGKNKSEHNGLGGMALDSMNHYGATDDTVTFANKDYLVSITINTVQG